MRVISDSAIRTTAGVRAMTRVGNAGPARLIATVDSTVYAVTPVNARRRSCHQRYRGEAAGAEASRVDDDDERAADHHVSVSKPSTVNPVRPADTIAVLASCSDAPTISHVEASNTTKATDSHARRIVRPFAIKARSVPRLCRTFVLFRDGAPKELVIDA